MSGLQWGRGRTSQPVTGLSRGRLRTRLPAGTDFEALESALAAMEADQASELVELMDTESSSGVGLDDSGADDR